MAASPTIRSKPTYTSLPRSVLHFAAAGRHTYPASLHVLVFSIVMRRGFGLDRRVLRARVPRVAAS